MDIKQIPGQGSQQQIETDKSSAKAVASDKLPSKNLPGQAVVSDDSVEISSLAGTLQKTLSTLDAVPEIDTVKIEAIKTSIKSGSYKIDTEAVASKLVDFELTFSK